MSSYKNYKIGTKVTIKATGQTGEAFESALGYISVFLDEDGDNAKAKIFEIEEVDIEENN